MTQLSKSPIDPALIEQFLTHQRREEYIRTLNKEEETVNYLPNSRSRFWYNNLMTAYDVHHHDAYELIFPTEGTYHVQIDRQHFALHPGDILMIPSGMVHELKPEGRGGRFIFLIPLDLATQGKVCEYLASCLDQPVLINRSTCPTIYNEEIAILNQLCRDYLEDDGLKDFAVYTRILTFLLTYGKFRAAQDADPAIQPSQKTPTEKFNALFAYLDRHYAEDLSLEHVAAVAGFSKYHFSRIFKQLSGNNFYDYLTRRRIKAAEMLLLQEEASISQIALQSGFSSLSTFNRVFRKVMGCTPTQYRSNIKKQGEHTDE